VPKQLATSHDGSQQMMIGADSTVYFRVDDPLKTPAPNFAPVPGLAGAARLQASRVALDSDPRNGDTQAIVLGTDGQLWHSLRSAATGQWTPWAQPAPTGFKATDAAIGIDGRGDAHIAVVDTARVVQYRMRYASNGSWSNWEQPLSKEPLVKAGRVAVSAATDGSGDMDLYYTDDRGGGSSLVGTVHKPSGRPFGGSVWIGLTPDHAAVTDLAVATTTAAVNGIATKLILVAAQTAGGHLVTTIRKNNGNAPFQDARVGPGLAGVAANITTSPPGLAITVVQ
jgi:hypothetical protein